MYIGSNNNSIGEQQKNHTETIEVTEKQYVTLLNALKSLREKFCRESAETFDCAACLIGQYGECIADKIETILGGIKKVYTAEIEVHDKETNKNK